MNTLLFFKRLDFWGQVLCILIPAIGLLLDAKDPLPYFAWAYGLECGWQAISSILNATLLDKFFWSPSRRGCNNLFIVIVVIFCLCFLSGEVMMVFLMIMLFVGPIAASMYLFVSYHEVKLIRAELNRKQFLP